MERNGFFFYKSFLDTIDMMDSDEEKLQMYEAITHYGIYAKEKKPKSKLAQMAWLNIVPVLRKNWRNFLNGCKEKSRKSKGAPKGNQNARKYVDDDEELPF